VVIEYESNRFRTRTDPDGGRNPTFDGKFIVTLIEGFREVSVSVWNSNTFTADELIGSTRFVHSL
jgi:Ca2+-dependent lipid-binding protein